MGFLRVKMMPVACGDNAVRFLPLRGERENGLAVVNAEVDQPGGPVVQVMFRMHQVTDEWLIYDVAVEGISLVATHRSSFSRQIRNSGMDRLLMSSARVTGAVC
ncbi:MAG: ABC transporter substrate-binding protein [Gammaproteobacteria bacterium]